MKIIFTDIFKEIPQKHFNILEDEVIDVVGSTENVKIIDLDGQSLKLFFGKPKDKDYYLLIEARWVEPELEIMSGVFKVFPFVIEKLNNNEPLTILQELAMRFGLPIQIGDQYNKFIFQDSFEIAPGATNKIVEIPKPKSNHFTQQMLARMRQENGKKYVDVKLAYCIDIESMVSYINENS